MSLWRIYALGGGLGHLTRAVALARRARGHDIEILTSSPFAAAVEVEGVQVRRFGTDVDPREVADAVGSPCDVLVVDTFPRGLGGELAPLLDAIAAPKVLIHRDLDPRYVRDVGIAAWVERYDLVLVPGEDAPFASSPRAEWTAPWLSVAPDALLSRREAQRRLGVEGPTVAVLASGRPAEIAFFADVAERLRAVVDASVLLLSPIRRVDHPEARVVWPFLPLVHGVDVIVGAGGYNTVHEARATRTPFVGVAMDRKYDQQHARLRDDERARGEASLIAAVRQHLAQATRRDDVRYEDGAARAVESIERLLESHRR